MWSLHVLYLFSRENKLYSFFGGGGRGRGSPFVYSTITNNFLDATSKLPLVNILDFFYQNQYDFVEVYW